MDKRVKIIITAFVAITLGLIVWAIVDNVNRIGKLAVTVEVYPKDAKVSVDGERISSGQHYITPGKHTFTASRSGFADAKQDVTISEDITYAGLVLQPQSDEAKKFVEDDPNSLDIEAITGKMFANEGIEVVGNYPVVGKLPYYDLTAPFSIDYGQDEKTPDRPYIVISYSVANSRPLALKWLYENNNGSLSNLDIRFKDESRIQSEQYRGQSNE